MKKLILLTIAAGCISFYAAANKKTVEHVVKPVENLYRIAQVHNTTVEDILKANPGLDPLKLKVGSCLKVPDNTQVSEGTVSQRPAEKNIAESADLSPFTGNNAAILKDVAAKTDVTQTADSHVSFDSDELQARYNELLRLKKEDNSITIVDMNKIKVNPVPLSTETAELLGDLKNSNKVLVVNLQIVLKDGTVKTFSNPEDQKKMLSEITSDLSIR